VSSSFTTILIPILLASDSFPGPVRTSAQAPGLERASEYLLSGSLFLIPFLLIIGFIPERLHSGAGLGKPGALLYSAGAAPGVWPGSPGYGASIQESCCNFSGDVPIVGTTGYSTWQIRQK
tara:strand:- start:119572 stop:119934 length:363 start_codon:yes stop_codon:yes gene_type:complete